jgi:hypothetical protein
MTHFRHAPRRLNRLVRVAGDLSLRSLLPEVLPFAESPSSLLRASAARSIPKLAEPEAARPILERLAHDPIEDVRKAAEAGQRDLKSAKKRERAADEAALPEEDEGGLSDDAMAALRRLMDELDEGSP